MTCWLSFLLFASVTLCILESKVNAQESGDCNCTSASASASTSPSAKSEPVCGHNGEKEVPFESQCEACCAFINDQIEGIAYFGRCNGSANATDFENDSSCLCDENHDSVCGNDKITYSNDCYRKCSTQENPCLFVARQGNCPHEDLDDDDDGTFDPWAMIESPLGDADDDFGIFNSSEFAGFNSSESAGGPNPEDDDDDDDLIKPYIAE